MAPSSTLAAHAGINRFNTPSPHPTHLSIGVHNQRVLTDDASGYVAPVFEGKEKQMELGKFYLFFSHLTVLLGEGRFQLLIVTVMDMLEEKGFIPPDFVESETKWFYSSLGIDGTSFAPLSESLSGIAFSVAQ